MVWVPFTSNLYVPTSCRCSESGQPCFSDVILWSLAEWSPAPPCPNYTRTVLWRCIPEEWHIWHWHWFLRYMHECRFFTDICYNVRCLKPKHSFVWLRSASLETKTENSKQATDAIPSSFRPLLFVICNKKLPTFYLIFPTIA